MKNINEIVQSKEKNRSNTSTVNTIIQELQKSVRYTNVVLSPEVPPGASLEALKQEYTNAREKLNGEYTPDHIKQALGNIYDTLDKIVWG